MSDTNRIIDLDPKNFKLKDYDNVHITMPKKPRMTEEDVDAQLFEYVLSSGKHIKSVADLDDTWVQQNFEGMNTISDVRDAIKAQYDSDLEFEYNNLKFRVCADALLARLEGEVPEDTIESNKEVLRQSQMDRLESMHLSLEQYLREEHMTIEQYENKLREETLYQMRMNVALDLMADVLNMQVGNHEITEYLSAPDPEKFLAELREKDQVEDARRAAVRVKVMRRIIDTAVVKEEDTSKKDAESTYEG